MGQTKDKQLTVLEAIKAKQSFCHFSVDDVFKIFNQPRGDAFKFLKSLWDEFGLITSLHLFSQPEAKRYLIQIADNSWAEYGWLKFGPHGPDFKRTYNLLMIHEQIEEIEHIYQQIERIASKNHFSPSVRLHFFQGTKDACHYLAKRGVEVIFTYDFFHDRISYYLLPGSREELNLRGYYYDTDTDLLFVKSSFRIEFKDDVERDTEDYLDKFGFCVFYTHEEFLTDPVMQEKIRTVLKMCQDRGIPFAI